MNIWTKKSIELASQGNYLDLLYKVYPMSVNLRRDLDTDVIETLTQAFNDRDSETLLATLLKQKLFPLKDSYVAYLRKDKGAVERNPVMVKRLADKLYELGLAEIIERSAAPKETNRQIGPLFKRWIDGGSLGVKTTESVQEFLNYDGNIVFTGSDKAMSTLAKEHLGYQHEKGLDFIGKFNGKYIIAEAKFLTSNGGHQNAQYQDAILTMRSKLNTDKDVQAIAILDGVVYIKSKDKLHVSITTGFSDDEVVISAVLLKDYLHSL